MDDIEIENICDEIMQKSLHKDFFDFGDFLVEKGCNGNDEKKIRWLLKNCGKLEGELSDRFVLDKEKRPFVIKGGFKAEREEKRRRENDRNLDREAKITGIETSKEANRLSDDSNKIAVKANEIAEKANRKATFSIIISFISTAISLFLLLA